MFFLHAVTKLLNLFGSLSSNSPPTTALGSSGIKPSKNRFRQSVQINGRCTCALVHLVIVFSFSDRSRRASGRVLRSRRGHRGAIFVRVSFSVRDTTLALRGDAGGEYRRRAPASVSTTTGEPAPASRHVKQI